LATLVSTLRPNVQPRIIQLPLRGCKLEMHGVGETHENVVYRVMDDTARNHSSGRQWKTLSRHTVPEHRDS
jgi:hypothetical protein